MSFTSHETECFPKYLQRPSEDNEVKKKKFHSKISLRSKENEIPVIPNVMNLVCKLKIFRLYKQKKLFIYDLDNKIII